MKKLITYKNNFMTRNKFLILTIFILAFYKNDIVKFERLNY